jgi:hypothetical protein
MFWCFVEVAGRNVQEHLHPTTFVEKALGKSGFLDFDFPVLDLSCDIPSVLLVFLC